MTSAEAYYLALKQGPANETRKAACQNSSVAFFYARDVDKEPHEDTRKAAYQEQWCKYRYALDLDKIIYPHTLEPPCGSIDRFKLKEKFEYD